MADHPLEPLTADEFRQTAAILRRDGHVTDTFRFASIELREPDKADVLAWTAGDPVPRTSFAVVWNRSDNQTYEATVDLAGDAVASFEHIPDVTPNFTVDEWHEVDVAMQAEPRRHRRAGRTRLHRLESGADRRLDVRQGADAGEVPRPAARLGDIWVRETPDGNPYAHPVSGMKLIVDMNTMELLEIEGHHDYGPPPVMGEYDPGPWPGPSCGPTSSRCRSPSPRARRSEVDGTEMRWQNWSMRLGFNYREGPVIYQVAYNDHGTERDIAYRMSFAEMVVPYRDPTLRPLPPDRVRHRRVGPRLHDHVAGARLRLPGRDRYVDAVLHDSHGEPYDDHQCHLPARGGQRRPLEARRLVNGGRGAAAAPDGGVLPRHGRELRVPRVLALLPGRQHRVRGPGDRHHGHHAVSPRATATPPPAPSSTTAPTRRSTSTSWSHGWTSTSTARQHRAGGGLRRRAVSDRTTRTAWPWSPTATPITLRGRIGPGLRLGHPARLEGGQPRRR